MEISLKTKLGILALIAFAVAAAVFATISPRITPPEENETDFFKDLEDANNYALVNFGFMGAFILSLYGAYTLPDLLKNTKGEVAARIGWLVYMPGAVLLSAFFAADGIHIQETRVQYYRDRADDVVRATVQDMTQHYFDTSEIVLFALVATILWMVGLALLALAIYQADETPMWLDGLIAAGVILLVLSLFSDIVILATLGYLALAGAFGGLGYLMLQAEQASGGASSET